jgi:AIPR protein
MSTNVYAFDCEKACRSHRTESGAELWTVAVRARHLPREFKLGPNARYAKLTNKPAREMLETLRTDPQSFVFKNNGMMLVTETIRAEGNRITVTCREPDVDEDFAGHGVLNGGHTYEALKFAMDEAENGNPAYSAAGEFASVMLTIGIGIQEDEIWKISRARNTSEKVPLHALRELAGDWSLLKKFLPEQSRKLVAFKPNEPGSEDAEYDVTELVRRLALLNNGMFPAEKNQHPVKAYSSIGALVRQYQQEDFLEVAPLLPDALNLEERVMREWDALRGKGQDKVAIAKATGVTKESTTLLNGSVVPIYLPAPFVLPVMAAFRVFIKNGQWARSIDDLWEKYGRRTIQALWDTYKEQGKSNPAMFGRNRTSWAATCDLTKSAAIQMGLITVD